MLTIYGVYRSRATRPLWLLAEIDHPFRLVPVIQAYRISEPMQPEAPLNTLSPDFLAINPMGSIPSMEDNGLVLHESLAISLYIARKYGGDLGPKDIDEEALMVQWSLFAATSIETPALKINVAISGNRQDSPDGKAEIEVAARQLKRPFDVLDKHLSQHGHIVGGRFTVADINVAECVRYAQGELSLLDGRPALKAWLETCQNRAGFKTMWDTRSMEPA
ncbi:glutathione S-transferase family protein [Neorhizobium sp. NPDC001467]|uniref:glutathione S-transferase family protein n=1 Tax=Neorhizobium sp. NPDC001467 TaxID=3390595 RepID=UPI003CFED526